MHGSEENPASVLDTQQLVVDKNKYGGAPILFMQEKTLFGDRVPSKEEWLRHEELYESIGSVIEPAHITGLQRVRGMWRIYIETLDDKVALLTQGISIRSKPIVLLHTNPLRPDGEGTTRIRVKNIPLSLDDSVIKHKFIQQGLDVITISREMLRIKGKLTNCQTGDRLVSIKSVTLKEPLPFTMQFAHFIGRVLHFGQPKNDRGNTQHDKCGKCLETGHKKADCTNEWKCMACNVSGHRKGECPIGDTQTRQDPPPDPIQIEENNGSSTRKDVVKAKRSGKKNTKKSGQSNIQQMHSGTQTPNKGRQTNVSAKDRSPPTPSEILNDQAKKGRVDSSGSDSESDNVSDC